MDSNTIKKRLFDEQNKLADYEQRQGGLGDELQRALNQRAETYATEENDVNSARNNYYNVTGEVLGKYKDDPNYGGNPIETLRRLESERAIRGTGYENSQDILNRRRDTVSNFINSMVGMGALNLDRQKASVSSLSQMLELALQEEERRRQANAQASLANLFGGGGNGGGQNTPPGAVEGASTGGAQPGQIVEKDGRLYRINPDGTATEITPQQGLGSQLTNAMNAGKNVPGLNSLINYANRNTERIIGPNQSLSSRLFGAASMINPVFGAAAEAVKPKDLGTKIVDAHKNIPVMNSITKFLFGK